MHRADERVWSAQRRINACARRNCTISFLRMIEQFFWELHCPGNIRDPSIKLAVDKISATSEEQPNRRGHNQIVAQVCPRDPVPVGVVKRERQYSEHSSVARHPTFPNAQDRQRLTQHFWFVEKNVAEAPAYDYAKECAAGDKIANSLWRKVGVAAVGQPKENKIAGDECEYISQPIPSWPDIVVNPKNNRIQAVQVICKHSVCWRLSLMLLTPAIKTRVIPSECEGPPKRGWIKQSTIRDAHF